MRRAFPLILGVLIIGWPAAGASAEEPPASLPSTSLLPQQADELAPPGGPPMVYQADAASPETGGHFVAGGGIYYVRPTFANNPAFFTDLAVGTPLQAHAGRDFDWGYDFAPLVWLGYVGEDGLGVRARYWRFDQASRALLSNGDSSGDVLVTTPSPLGLDITSPGIVLFKQGVDTLAFDSSLKLDSLDLEATLEGGAGPWWIGLSAGARYAHVAQEYNAYRNDPPSNPQGVIPGCNPSGNQPKKCITVQPPPPPPPGSPPGSPPGPGGGPGTGPGGVMVGPGGLNAQAIPILIIQDQDVLRSGHNYNGAGPTFAVEARRPLGDFGLAVYGSARGSVLFGRSRQEANVATLLVGEYVVAGGPNVPFSGGHFDRQREGRDLVMPVVELEVGAEWGADWAGGRLFARTGVVHQTWFGAGDASSDRGQLGFFGLTVSAGLSY
jgi:hypothetical protein